MTRFLIGIMQIALLSLAMWAAPGYAAQFSLTVISGSGSGSYEEGTTAYLTANPYDSLDPNAVASEPLDPQAPDRIFDRWTGDIGLLEDEFAARTTLVMPTANVLVTATYKDVSRWMPSRVLTHFPPNHRGVIFRFHGSFGDALNAYSLLETRSISKEAASRGFAVVAIDSFDRSSINRWDLTPTAAGNHDMQRVAAVRNNLINQGIMSPSDPVYAMGISNGGKFASLWTQENQDALGFPVEAAALYISSGETEVLETSTVPTIFALGVNDSQLDGKLNLGAQQAFDSLVTRGVSAQLWMSHPTPVIPERFWGITGLTLNDSMNIHSALEQNGFLDANNFLIDNPVYSDWRMVIPEEYEDYIGELEWHLACAYAEHAVMLKFTDKVLNFFDNPTTYIDAAPAITAFTPASGYAGTPMEISGENFYGVTDVRFNGVSVADFTVIGGSRIGVQFPAGATSGPIEVINSIGTGVSSTDVEVLPPTITEIALTSGSVGTAVQITGEGFVGITEVTFNGVPAEILEEYFTVLWVTVPAGATTGPIQVSNYVGTATSQGDFLVNGPEIRALEPTSGRIDAAVKITGSGFGDLTAVRFGGVRVTNILYSNSTLIWVRVPAGAITGEIEVETGSGLSASAEPFTVIAPPVISGFQPDRGPIGTEILITGSGFSTTTLVRLGGADDGAFDILSDTEIRATIPAGAKTGKILVANPAGYNVSGGYLIITP